MWPGIQDILMEQKKEKKEKKKGVSFHGQEVWDPPAPSRYSIQNTPITYLPALVTSNSSNSLLSKDALTMCLRNSFLNTNKELVQHIVSLRINMKRGTKKLFYYKGFRVSFFKKKNQMFIGKRKQQTI